MPPLTCAPYAPQSEGAWAKFRLLLIILTNLSLCLLVKRKTKAREKVSCCNGHLSFSRFGDLFPLEKCGFHCHLRFWWYVLKTPQDVLAQLPLTVIGLCPFTEGKYNRNASCTSNSNYRNTIFDCHILHPSRLMRD